MRKLWVVPALLVLILGLSSPGWARVVRMETAVPLTDRSEAAVEAALRGALETCVRGAMAMGLSWIRLERATLGEDRVIVHMIGSDDDDEDEGRVDEPQGERPAPPSRPAFDTL